MSSVEKLQAECEQLKKENQELKKRIHAIKSHEKIDEDRSAVIINSTSDAVIATDTKGHITFWNKGAERMYGYSSEEVMNRPVSFLYKNDDVHILESIIADLLNGKDIHNIEVTCIDKMKNDVHILLSLTTLKDNQGQITELVGFTRDVREYKKTINKLYESEERYRLLHQSAGVGVGYYTPDGKVIAFNEIALKHMDLPLKEVIGKSVYDLFTEEDADTYMNRLNNSMLACQPMEYEDEIPLKTGSKWFLSIYNCVRDSEDNAIGVQIVSVDISKNKQTELDLKRREKFLKAIFEHSLNAIMVADDQGNYKAVNQAAADMFGYTVEQLLKMNIKDLKTIEEPGAAERYQEYIKKNKEIGTFDFIRPDGETRLAHYHAVRIDKDFHLSILVDMTDHEKSVRQLTEMKQQFESFMEHLPGAAYIKNSEHQLLYCNSFFASILGKTPQEIIGKKSFEYTPADMLETFNQENDHVFTSLQVHETEHVYPSAGEDTWWMTRKFPIQMENGNILLGTVSFDITKQKQFEESLQRERNLAQSYLDIASVMMLALDSKGLVTMINQKGCDVLGYNQKELIGKNWFDHFLPGVNVKQVKEIFAQLMAGDVQMGEYAENLVQAKNGNHKIIAWHNSILKDEQGNTIGTLSSGQDISARKQAEEQLKSQNERLNYIIEGTNLGTWEWNIQTGETIFNEEWANIIGYTLEEISPVTIETWNRFSHPEDLKESNRLLNKHFNGESDFYRIEYRMKHKKGHWVWVVDCGKVVSRTDDKKPLWMFGTHQEITDRKLAEEALQESQAKLTQIVDGSSIATLVIDKNHRITHWNKACEKLTGFSASQMIGTKNQWLTFYNEKRDILGDVVIRKNLKNKLNKYYKGKCQKSSLIESGYEGEDFFPNLGDSGKWLFFTAVPLRAKDGTIFGAIETLQDITEQKKLEQSLLSTVNNLESKNAEMERFIYTVSHDLKSPMITIEGFIGLIRQEIENGNTQKILESMTFISNAMHQMKNLLNDLLELSRIGRVVNVSTTVTMNEIIEDAILLLSGSIGKYNAEIDVQPDMPKVLVDRIRIKEVVVNLIENSIKYRNQTLTPKIQIGCHEDKENYTFYVKDNGIGIDPKYHDKVFGLFDQLDPNIEGTGVGLALVQRIIEYHNGKIWVQSEGVDKGATFFFTLPKKI